MRANSERTRTKPEKVVFNLDCFSFLLKIITITKLYLLTSETEDKDQNYRDSVILAERKRLLLITKKRKSSRGRRKTRQETSLNWRRAPEVSHHLLLFWVLLLSQHRALRVLNSAT